MCRACGGCWGVGPPGFLLLRRFRGFRFPVSYRTPDFRVSVCVGLEDVGVWRGAKGFCCLCFTFWGLWLQHMGFRVYGFQVFASSSVMRCGGSSGSWWI